MNNWILLSLLGVALWSAPNVLDNYVRSNYIKNDFYLTLISSLLKLPVLLLIFAFTDFHFPPTAIFLQLFFAGLVWGCSLFFYFKAFDYDDSSTIAIYIQLLPIPTLLIANLMLGEVLTTQQFIGFIIMLLGGVLASMKKVNMRFHLSKAFFFIGLTDFLWAFSDVSFKALEPSFENYFSAFCVYLFGSFAASMIIPFMPIPGRESRPIMKNLNWPGVLLILLSTTLAVLGTVLFAYALTLGKASLISLAAGLQPIFVIIWGLIFAKMLKGLKSDKLTPEVIKLKLISITILFIGLLLIQQ